MHTLKAVCTVCAILMTIIYVVETYGSDLIFRFHTIPYHMIRVRESEKK